MTGAVVALQPTTRPTITLSAVFKTALYYGVAGFGGGYSVLAQLRRDLVDQRAWLSAEEFLVLAELSKSLPGTPATNLITLLGQRVHGARGGIAAACAFLFPSTVLMIICGALYSHFRSAASLTMFFDGMNAAMVGIVAAVTVDLGRSALHSKVDLLIAVVCALVLSLRIVSEPALACGGVLVGGFIASVRAKSKSAAHAEHSPPSQRLHGFALLTPFAIPGGIASIAALVRVFVPIGVLTFGGGLAMIPAIEHVVVNEQHWLLPKEFADAIALGQITPGPVAICATFIGYRVAGIVGALVATLAMFGPAVALTLAAGHSTERFRGSVVVQGAFRALAPVVIGMLAAATFSLAHSGAIGVLGAVVALASFVVLVRFSVSPLWLLVAGGVVHVIAMRAHL
jgi:chromate transporter